MLANWDRVARVPPYRVKGLRPRATDPAAAGGTYWHKRPEGEGSACLACAETFPSGNHFLWEECKMGEVKEIRPGIAVVIFNGKGEVLLQKRADVNLWGIPSGHVEPGETVEAAAIREVFEETGLSVKIIRLIGVYSDPSSQIFHYPDGRVIHFVTCCFQAEVIGGELRAASPETLDLRYFPCDRLPEDILKMHPLWLADALSPTVQAFIR